MAEPDADRTSALSCKAARSSRKRAAIVPGALLERILLDILANDDVPLSAYALAAGLRAHGRAVPMPSIYRALDRLVSNGAIERVETRSAYRIRDKVEAVLMICVLCGRTTSLAVPAEHQSLMLALRDQAFAIHGLALEATGLCSTCGRPSSGGLGSRPSRVDGDRTS